MYAQNITQNDTQKIPKLGLLIERKIWWRCTMGNWNFSLHALHNLQYYTVYFGEGNGNPFQYSCLENCMDWGAWWATVHGLAELDTTEQLHYLFYNQIKSNSADPDRHSHICLKTWIYFRPTNVDSGVHLKNDWRSMQLFFCFLFFNYLFCFAVLYWFCHTLTWICHECTCVLHPEPPSHLPPHPTPLGHPSAPAPSTLYHASNLDWWFVSHMIFYMFQWHSPLSSCPRPLPQSPKDCYIHLCLFCCLK